MRFISPDRDHVDPAVFKWPPLAQWREFDALLHGTDWPTIETLNTFVEIAANGTMPHGGGMLPRFVAQTPALLADGLHYEQRIAKHAAIATRERNWHDLLNALVWLRFPGLKAALNARQIAEIERIGPKQRSRAQCALTHFDEAGVIVTLRDDPQLLALWDAHDWHGLFWRKRAAWNDGRIAVSVFGHALLEHALKPQQLLVGKALVLQQSGNGENAAICATAEAIARGVALCDPQELRPLPLSGIPGWYEGNDSEQFYRDTPCFQPVRAGRTYPPPLVLPA
jgi:hypothetical protein